MKDYSFNLPSTRREFLGQSARGIGLLAFCQYAPSFLTQSAYAGAPLPERDRTILVLIQLAGGNDGLNTLIPYEDDRYYKLRPRLAIDRREILPAYDGFGFHPACTSMLELFKEGQLGIIQNVGYPNPNRSHFRSSEIWETASDSNEYVSTGWLGRYFDNSCNGTPEDEDPNGIHVTDQLPQLFLSNNPHNLFGLSRAGLRRKGQGSSLLDDLMETPALGDNVKFLQHTMMDALVTEKHIRNITVGYRPMVDYPASRLSASLRSVAAMITAGLSTRVYFVSQGGYDTHTNQAQTQNRLLDELSESMAAFQHDLQAHGLQDQVLTMTFSEFGRRPAENSGGGTDHGTAAPLFVMGGKLRKHILGTPPSLNVGPKQDLVYSTDFRRVYATILQNWLNCDSAQVLDGNFDSLDFV